MSRPRATLLAAGLTTAAALGLLLPGATVADPAAVREQRAEVARIQSQLEDIDRQAGSAAEAYNGARWRLGQVEDRIGRNTRLITTTSSNLARARTVLAKRLRAIYATPPPSVVHVILDSGSITGAVDSVELVERVGEQDGAIVQDIRQDLGRLKEARVQLVADRRTARRQVETARVQRDRVQALLRRRQAVLDSAQGRLRTLVREEQARQRAAAEAERQRAVALQRAAAQNAPAATAGGTAPASSSPSSPSAPQTAPVASGSGNAAVVGIAMRYLGVPYVWGGASPSGFDCSGLASYVYAQIGKSVPHYTGAIWAAFPKVSSGDLQPGDMVFFHRDLGHMGIYIGNGQFIHAPHTGDVVKISSLADRAGSYVGAVRP
jgi:cell wall-associated NlpC family hydrolase